ncbi:MAG: ATP-binding protein, partial [Polyangiaceae bacterium]|nr:ATP-binding protein [Polyangiaceae bacterium]
MNERNGSALPLELLQLKEPKVIKPLLGMGHVLSGTLIGLEMHPIRVEVACRRGPSSFQLAGLAEAAVREARIRVQSALRCLGIELDEYSLTVSLAPANLKKRGSGLDLALALAVLIAIGRLKQEFLEDTFIIGELGLDGALRGVPGVLPLLQGAAKQGSVRALIPAHNAAEGQLLQNSRVSAVQHLKDIVLAHKTKQSLPTLTPSDLLGFCAPAELLEDVQGQAAAKRALIIAAAGAHHLLMIGPPGAGKSLLARRLPALLPPLNLDEALEAMAIRSIAGLLGDSRNLDATPTFRAPHHTVSDIGLVGGSTPPRPGEISLAHQGVLFLDELPEFRRSALEALRQPLEEH